MTPRTPLTLLALAAGASLLAACAVGPNYAGPPAAAPVSVAAGHFHRAQSDATPAPAPARWWEALNDPQLTALIDQALAHSPTVREAQDRVRSARASVGEDRAKLLPTGGGSALEASARIPTSSFGSLLGGSGAAAGGGGGGASATSFNLYSVGFDASWELDIFGGTRRQIEAARAQADAQDAQLHDAEVELAAEVAQAYVNLRDAQTRLALTEQDQALEQHALQLIRQQRAQGVAADGDIERGVSDLTQIQAQLPTLRGQTEQYADQLAILTGAEPGALDAQLAATAPVPAPPATTPVGDPATLLRHRPDIRQAERQLAASNAQIGQHVADLFPKVSLLGDIGFAANDPGQVFKAANFSAIGAPSLSWDILKYPQIHAQIKEAQASRDAAADHYEATVLSALQDAEASLSRYGHQRESLASLIAAEDSARRAEALTESRYQRGAASLIDLLDAQRQRVSTRESLAQGRAAFTNDYIALQKSLGLGWSEPAPLAQATTSRTRPSS